MYYILHKTDKYRIMALILQDQSHVTTVCNILMFSLFIVAYTVHAVSDTIFTTNLYHIFKSSMSVQYAGISVSTQP